MTILSRKLIVSTAATIAFAGGLFWNGQAAVDKSLVASAEARVGRPLTPMSYAGVARRTTRRAVAVGAGAAAAGAYYGSGCVQAVDAYGRVVTRC
ncbi:hypothetical protein [Bradyrhizobium sp. BWA-3-5]|uniref:hypothetical protein n=1 Tax=Bradyrhizobium sp. BWA-3-5 TaxID=3080013 RepID=UPI00293F0849|nr:hypothetical protein [Bradyrhizobium sp. BWA-3-5]WOH67932.1 hypothetical protein RX331_09495 [Bradyrhizobium sp. BWA-3-5]